MPPEIVIHHLRQARAVLNIAETAGCKVQLRSAPAAAAFAGVGYLHALGEALGHELLVDCHDDAGLAMAALRTGCQKLIFSGDLETHRRLGEMAALVNADIRLESAPPPCLLMLSPDDDIEQVRQWLGSLPDRPAASSRS